jgi:CBS-domain-containing membrane protein
MFLRSASAASYEQVVMRSALEGVPVRRFMRIDPITVRPDITIQGLVDDYIYRYHHKMFPVVNDAQECAGCVTIDDVKQLPREEWPRHTVAEVLQPRSNRNTVDPEAGAAQVLSMLSDGMNRVLVVDGSRVAGVVSSIDLLNFLKTKLDLEGEAASARRRRDLPSPETPHQETEEKTRTAGG